jgi:hypothetical protein
MSAEQVVWFWTHSGLAAREDDAARQWKRCEYGARRNPRGHHDHARDRYWITSSAVASSVSGTVRPSALAVLRFSANSNLIGCWTGRSPGLSPRNI